MQTSDQDPPPHLRPSRHLWGTCREDDCTTRTRGERCLEHQREVHAGDTVRYESATGATRYAIVLEAGEDHLLVEPVTSKYILALPLERWEATRFEVGRDED